MLRRYGIKRILGWVIAAALMALNYTPSAVAFKLLPDKIYIEPGETAHLPDIGEWIVLRDDGVAVSSLTNQRLDEVMAQGETQELQYELFGVVPVKTVGVIRRERKLIVPGGCSVGVTMFTKGALVVGVSDIVTNTGEAYNPCKAAGLMPGDVVEKSNGVAIKSKEHLSELVESAKGAPIELEVLRKGQKLKLSIVPVMDNQEGEYRLGFWARDSTAGVGTMTFYDPATGIYGALGHAVTDLDTKERLHLKNGELVQSDIVDIRHGSKGTPGELKGSFESARHKLGTIEKNTEFGIFGKLHKPYKNPIYPEPMPVAAQDEVKIGPAEILTTINAGTKAFACEIERISPQSRPSPKGMIVRVTDSELLSATGGIVQGMSGSPIIQDGKVVGAVTHVNVICYPTRKEDVKCPIRP